MTKRWRIRLVVLAVLLGGGFGVWFAMLRPRHGPTPARGAGVVLVPVAGGFENPTHLISPPGDARLFVVEQAGTIRVIRDGVVQPRAWLDITDRVGSGGERGLLSLAFDPAFARNGRFYVNYTDLRGDTRISRFVADPRADTADPGSERILLAVNQPYANHNGGHILFGPDGALYAGMGDGGAAGDPGNRAQNPRELLGKLLRLTLRADGSVSTEIWAIGLRNPWRIAFDPAEGMLYIADVGQNAWEEVNAVPASLSGINYGWRRREGRHCFLVPLCSSDGLTDPVFEYGHADGCSITGGVVYRGRAVPALVGHYLFSDWCAGWIRSFRLAGGAARDYTEWDPGTAGSVTSFGVDSAGEVYVLSSGGSVFRLASR
ncbi:MAG TPA: PQQ-dependent sugar dehydrogenase [Gemmatimonadales bacterium]|nr:PQQ-dependent sugar dehydrogenase [Gemmatimonadales bacterium]